MLAKQFEDKENIHKNLALARTMSESRLGRSSYIQNIPKFPKTTTEIYIDFEGLPEENFIYLIGLVIKEQETEKQLSFWANSKEEEKNIFQQFFDIVSGYNDATIYHYGSYESRILKQIKRIFNNQYEDVLGRIFQNSCNILSLHRIFIPLPIPMDSKTSQIF